MTDLNVMKNFSEKEWYNLFVTILLDSHGIELENFYNNVKNAINEVVEIGTGTQIIQGKNICSNVIIGAGAVVVKDIEEDYADYLQGNAKVIEVA